MPSPDVAIVGAGVIGSAVAYTLSRSTRLRIVVIERGVPGCEASNAAAGVLAVASGQARRGVLLELRRISAAMFPELVATLEDETGLDLGYRREGLLSLAFSEADAASLAELVRHRQRQGMRCHFLDRAAVLSSEPAVDPSIRAAAHFPDDCAIDSARFVAALVAGAQRRGVEFRLHAAVRSVCAANGAARLEVDGAVLEAGMAVVAAGAWSGELLNRPGLKIPVRPARGEMLALRPTSVQVRHTLAEGETYLVPRSDGELLVGSTLAFVGYDKRVTDAGVERLLANAVRVLPGLRGTDPCRTWAGLRPCSTIRRPIIAPLPGLDNVILANGHHRNGVLLAPITAQLVTEMIGGAAPSVPLRPFSYRRH
ncbi:MAG: glycine oxidase ThiO [Candidatus Binatia bacterium]